MNKLDMRNAVVAALRNDNNECLACHRKNGNVNWKAFREYKTTPVPLPASAYVFGAGVLALLFMKRRIRA